jgi:hypothetical protein
MKELNRLWQISVAANSVIEEPVERLDAHRILADLTSFRKSETAIIDETGVGVSAFIVWSGKHRHESSFSGIAVSIFCGRNSIGESIPGGVVFDGEIRVSGQDKFFDGFDVHCLAPCFESINYFINDDVFL